jgi:alpha-1,3/alpha-1,6-mannosyltransferase
VNIAFVHPELGLGGAERLVLDAATELRARGHRVVLLTTRCNPARAFPEAVDGSLDVRVHGRALPRQVGGRLRAPCAIARMAWLASVLGRLEERPDVVVCDLVAHVVPLLNRTAKAPVVVYCHHPDRLLARRAEGPARWYRGVIERLEVIGTAAADRVLVNSEFTARRLREAFPRLAVSPTVVYPGVEPFDDSPDLPEEPPPGPVVVLAVGRFAPEKRMQLAVDALGTLRARLPSPAFARVRLVLAGGYDAHLREQRATVATLEARIRADGLDAQVELRRSPSESERRALLVGCRFVVHTQVDEHFGYVPVEAMAAGRPVIAIASGGPVETVADGRTGLLCAPTREAIAHAMARLLTDPHATARMGRRGRAWVAARFSRAAFGARLEAILAEVAARRRPGA